MTNNWADMANSTLFVFMGSNAVENHPASIAHILRAHDERPAAKMIVIDPRKTRTAVLAEQKGGRFIRIRPGTDIAFVMGLVREVIRRMEGLSGSVPQPVRDLFFEFLNETQSSDTDTTRNQFFNIGDETTPSTLRFVPGGSKYTDARFVVNSAGTDYERFDYKADPGDPDATAVEFLPVKAGDCRDAGTAYSALKAHVAAYTPSVVANICGCTEEELLFVAQAYVDNSRAMSSYLTGQPVVGASDRQQDPRDKANYRATQMLYAMGLTQHTHGSQNVKAFATLMALTGNVGRAGGAINALRGIHNVQGSTDMGVLQHLIPGYSGNPGLMAYGHATPAMNDANAFGKYMDRLWGLPVRGANGRQVMNDSYEDAYRTRTEAGALDNATHGLQGRGFYNMTLKWFGDFDVIDAMPFNDAAAKAAKRAAVDAIYNLWPKTNGDDHITMFRKMAAGQIKGCVVWGQNPAVTEPNQKYVRDGLEELDVLVVVDMFDTETSAAKRKSDGVTYLLPACSHVEEAGSTANSGRVLQWRERAIAPVGNSKADLELLLRLAYAFDKADAFSHIRAVWNSAPLNWGVSNNPADTAVYNKLYKDQHGWSPADAVAFEDRSDTTEMWYANKTAPESATVYGSELVAESLYIQCTRPVYTGGTMWLYTGAWDSTRSTNVHVGQGNWAVDNRAKSRNNADPNQTYAYPAWGYSWLVNRRVLYNNLDIPGDVVDYYMTPDSVARLFVPAQPATIHYSRWWRFVHGLADRPDVVLPATSNPASPHYVSPGLSYSGRFPGHTEPYETPREDLAALWGRNTRGVAKWDLIHSGNSDNGGYSGTTIATSDASYPGPTADPTQFPLVLTTIRCVEHFQGGPITRNNPWNVEIEPTPWIEINSADAATYQIKTGDMVNIVTARSNSTSDQEGRTEGEVFAKGFIARVGVGASSNQRVGRGVVAIPWHWGDKGLSTGSRANDLCIDAFDANTRIPEYKACTCRIEKA